MAQYNYSIQDDFPNHKVAPSRLKQEIEAKAEILVALDVPAITTIGDACSIRFKADLPAEQKTALDQVVASHSGEPLNTGNAPIPVKEIDVADLDPNYARSKSYGVNFDAAAGQWTKKDCVWPYDINVLNGEGYAGFAEDGDKAEFRVKPQLVGVVVAPAAQDATTIVVDDGIKGLFTLKTIFPGMVFKFKRDGVPGYPDNPDPESDEYEIEAFDPDTNAVTLRSGLASAVPAMSLVYLTIKYGETIELQQGESVNVGGCAAGSAPVPANTVFEIWYYCVSAAKRVRLRLNLKYGPKNGG